MKHPQERGVYAWTRDKKGEFLLFIGRESNVLSFQQLPDLHRISITEGEFGEALRNSLLDFVEVLPSEVYEVSLANLKN